MPETGPSRETSLYSGNLPPVCPGTCLQPVPETRLQSVPETRLQPVPETRRRYVPETCFQPVPETYIPLYHKGTVRGEHLRNWLIDRRQNTGIVLVAA